MIKSKVRQGISEDGAMMIVEVTLYPKTEDDRDKLVSAKAFSNFLVRVDRDAGGNPLIRFAHPLWKGVGKKEE